MPRHAKTGAMHYHEAELWARMKKSGVFSRALRALTRSEEIPGIHRELLK